MLSPRFSLLAFFLVALNGQIAKAQPSPLLPTEEDAGTVLAPSPVNNEELSSTSPIQAGCVCSDCGVADTVGHRWHYHIKPRLQDSHWGYEEYFHERPFGRFNRTFMQLQVRNGIVRQLVLFQYDFNNNDNQEDHLLNENGEAQLSKIAEQVMRLGQPVVIQQSSRGREIDEKRRMHVVTKLARFEIPESMVVVQRVPITGLGAAGEQDLPSQNPWNTIYENRLLQTLDQGSRQLQGSLGP